jgi:hypothetical protein
MPHVLGDDLHGYINRALAFTIDVDTDEEADDWSNVTWRINDILEITDLTAVDGGIGITVDVDLTAANLDLPVGVYQWELLATVDGEVHTRGIGDFRLDAEPTITPPV